MNRANGHGQAHAANNNHNVQLWRPDRHVRAVQGGVAKHSPKKQKKKAAPSGYGANAAGPNEPFVPPKDFGARLKAGLCLQSKTPRAAVVPACIAHTCKKDPTPFA